MKVLDGFADKPTLSLPPWADDIGIQAPPAAETSDPTFPTLAAYLDVVELAGVGMLDMSEIGPFHPDHDRAGCDMAVSHDTIIGISGSAP